MSELANMESMMKRARIWFVAAAFLIGAVSADAMANARDPDGSRMQASLVSVGGSSRNSLNPPKDSVDWYYFKLSKAQKVSIQVAEKPAGTSARLRLTDAVGRSVGSASARDGKASISRRLDPGVYYVSVSSSSKIAYTLSIR